MSNGETKAALSQMKQEIASELGVNVSQGSYNGDLTAKQNGSIGGYMVKRMYDQYYSKHGVS